MCKASVTCLIVDSYIPDFLVHECYTSRYCQTKVKSLLEAFMNGCKLNEGLTVLLIRPLLDQLANRR